MEPRGQAFFSFTTVYIQLPISRLLWGPTDRSAVEERTRTGQTRLTGRSRIKLWSLGRRGPDLAIADPALIALDRQSPGNKKRCDAGAVSLSERMRGNHQEMQGEKHTQREREGGRADSSQQQGCPPTLMIATKYSVRGSSDAPSFDLIAKHWKWGLSGSASREFSEVRRDGGSGSSMMRHLCISWTLPAGCAWHGT